MFNPPLNFKSLAEDFFTAAGGRPDRGATARDCCRLGLEAKDEERREIRSGEDRK